MVVIRLARGGAKHRPFYHIVAADQRMPRNGRFLEKIGFYNPIARGGETSLRLDSDIYQQWLDKGAQPSTRVKSLYKLWTKGDGQDLPARFAKTEKIPLDAAKSVKPAAKAVDTANEQAAEDADAATETA